MARKCRAEIEGGLYHVISRGNNRRRIFSKPADYDKFLTLLARQKARLPFFLYAYCLMTNHFHLLIERQADSIGKIMHRLLTGYSHYYNRRYRRVGHLFQERHKSILCQSDRYLAELVRYIHLNPVRAGMVDRPEHYEYSGHREYLGLEAVGLVDVDPVLRHFGAKKELARAHYQQFLMAGIKRGHRKEFYPADDGRILGAEEFIDATIHHIGETKGKRKSPARAGQFGLSSETLLLAVEKICRMRRQEFCGSAKRAAAVWAKEVLIVAGFDLGVTMKRLSEIIGLNSSTVSRRYDAAVRKTQNNSELSKTIAAIKKECSKRR